METCPENSVECLLRRILDTQSGFNWNGPTFIVTVLIGILALIVAIATVFQGLLFSGPGRLKASWRAIGPWSTFTETKFSWTELRFRTTACVPYIASTESFANFDFDRHMRTGSILRSRGRRADEVQRGENNDHVNTNSYAAGWLNLLNKLSTLPHFRTIRRDTEHLPTDVSAVPTFGTIEAIVKLAAVAGCDTIKMVQGYRFPSVHGFSSQLSFREHPYLGVISVYQQFPRAPTYSSPHYSMPQRSQTLTAKYRLASIHDSARELSWWRTKPELKFELPKKRASGCEHTTCSDAPPKLPTPYTLINSGGCLTSTFLVLLIDHWYPRALLFSKLRIRPAIQSFCLRNCDSMLLGEYEVIASTISSCLAKRSKKLFWDCTEDPKYAGDRSYSVYFDRIPKASDFSPLRVASNDLHGSTWLPSHNVTSPIPKFRHRVDISAVELPLNTGKERQVAEMLETSRMSLGPSGLPLRNSVQPGEDDLVIFPLAFFTAIDWLKDEDVLNELDFDRKSALRAAFSYQIRELDSWLLNHGGRDSACEALQILYGSEAHGERYWGSEVRRLRPNRSPGRTHNVVNSPNGLRVLLMYRALLTAVLCATAADTSCVEGTELGQQVVQIL